MGAADEQGTAGKAARIGRLLDAIDLLKGDEREQAQALLRDLIREDNDFEDAWLWMSVAVSQIDQSALCLENVLRINPNNAQAAGALYRLRESEMLMAKRRVHYRNRRDLAFTGLWLLVALLLTAVFLTYSNALMAVLDSVAEMTPQLFPP